MPSLNQMLGYCDQAFVTKTARAIADKELTPVASIRSKKERTLLEEATRRAREIIAFETGDHKPPLTEEQKALRELAFDIGNHQESAQKFFQQEFAQQPLRDFGQDQYRFRPLDFDRVPPDFRLPPKLMFQAPVFPGYGRMVRFEQYHPVQIKPMHEWESCFGLRLSASEVRELGRATQPGNQLRVIATSFDKLVLEDQFGYTYTTYAAFIQGV